MLDFIQAGPDDAPPIAPTVVLCHGFGANMHDLAAIAGEATAPSYRWIFPQAPAEIPGYPAGRAWFPRTPGELLQFASGADFHDLAGMDPDGLRASGEELIDLLTSVGTDLSRTVIGGFSQGAMVAIEAVLSAAGGELPAGLAVLSGSLIAANRWAGMAPGIAKVPVFQSHGTVDPVLPFEQATRLREVLIGAGASVDFVEFAGGHGVPPEVVDRLGAFIARVLPE
ncbi:MAG: phospholipase [Spirochaetaceae bacterium]|nr:MAG: phospholipase [Spirochaetaceae bacterium]